MNHSFPPCVTVLTDSVVEKECCSCVFASLFRPVNISFCSFQPNRRKTSHTEYLINWLSYPEGTHFLGKQFLPLVMINKMAATVSPKSCDLEPLKEVDLIGFRDKRSIFNCITFFSSLFLVRPGVMNGHSRISMATAELPWLWEWGGLKCLYVWRCRSEGVSEGKQGGWVSNKRLVFLLQFASDLFMSIFF